MKYVAYYRVSTDKQGNSGLGLDAQRRAVEQYSPVKEFTEIESGGNNSRPILQKAIEYCKDNGYCLVIAKLDRLARSVYFISSLIETKVDFVAADMPNANKFTLHIFAAAAELERDQISERTKAGMVGADLHSEQRQAEWKQKTIRSYERIAKFLPILQKFNHLDTDELCEKFNERGITTTRGVKWNVWQIRRLRLKARNLHNLNSHLQSMMCMRTRA